jgi:hypothetical protein
MESLYMQTKDEAEKMQRTIQQLENDLETWKNKISILDKIAFSSELYYKRKEQQLQELTSQKDRLEKLIANALNGEGYSKLNQFIKENVKAVLAENKSLILISFTAIIQTLKSDPQMVKLIQNIPSATDGEKYIDDNDNIIKYLEFNKDRILWLSEKNYENLIEALTNNAIYTAADASSNSTLLLPQSLSTIPNLSNQKDTYRVEK